MLMPIDSDRRITSVPHPQIFCTLRERLGRDRFAEIVDYINGQIDSVGEEHFPANRLARGAPPGEFTGTPLQPIYDIAAEGDYDLAGKMFGLIVWYTLMHRPERWRFYRPEGDGDRIMGMIYFRPR